MSRVVASLPMYQRPQLVGEHRRYWTLIRSVLLGAGIDAPRDLSQHGDEFETWTDPGLVLSQTCGMPYRNRLHGQVMLIGTPDFGVEGCAPGYYRSALIVRSDERRQKIEDFASSTFAYNQDHSQSGYAAAYTHVEQLGFWFEHRLRTGQHLASAKSVATGRADIAAIDAVTWRLVERHEPCADQLRVLDWTAPSPGLPYITRLGGNADLVYRAIEEAITRLSAADRVALGLCGMVHISADDYLAVPDPPAVITSALGG